MLNKLTEKDQKILIEFVVQIENDNLKNIFNN